MFDPIYELFANRWNHTEGGGRGGTKLSSHIVKS